jgi:hypothetical protein
VTKSELIPAFDVITGKVEGVIGNTGPKRISSALPSLLSRAAPTPRGPHRDNATVRRAARICDLKEMLGVKDTSSLLITPLWVRGPRLPIGWTRDIIPI